MKLKECTTLSDLGTFLQNVRPMVGTFGGRYFVSQDTKNTSSMNEIIYQLQQIVKGKKTDKIDLTACYEKIVELERSIDLSTTSRPIQILTKMRQLLGNFIFSITHNRFNRNEALKEIGYLKQAGYTDFVNAVEKHDEDAVSLILKYVNDADGRTYATDFLGSIYRKAERDDKRIKTVLAALETRFPEVDFKKYFISKFEGIILCPDGLRIILDYLKEKGSIRPDTNIIVCDSLEELTEQVKRLDWSREFRVGFLVRARNVDRPTELHIIPGYLENRPGKQPELLVTDTAGRAESIYSNVKTTYTNVFVNHFKRGLSNNIMPKVYANGFLRQYNWTACPIFSIRDLVQIFRNPSVMNQVRERYSGSGEPVIFMDDLPLVLMKPHHGLTVLDKIASSKEGREVAVGLNKAKQPESLYDNLQRHKIAVFKGENSKLLNNYTNEREVKYLKLILNTILPGGHAA